jgi:hypothetical protein
MKYLISDFDYYNFVSLLPTFSITKWVLSL